MGGRPSFPRRAEGLFQRRTMGRRGLTGQLQGRKRETRRRPKPKMGENARRTHANNREGPDALDWFSTEKVNLQNSPPTHNFPLKQIRGGPKRERNGYPP